MGNICLSSKELTKTAGGSVLDRVISQASNEDDCLLYKLADYKKGGELINVYNNGGQEEAEKFISEKLHGLMYNSGKGQVINRNDYLRWKHQNQKHISINLENKLGPHDPLKKWVDHLACWQMQYRGSLGESLLHVLIMCDTTLHTRLSRLLLKYYPILSQDIVEGEEYLGASALHLAIAYNNNDLIQDLVDAGANICQRAIGSFFLPRDQQNKELNSKHTDYEGLAYLGEFPLAWAACCGNQTVYNLLIDTGANPDAQDSFGNMILHMVVVCDKLSMFGFALKHPKVPASNGIMNIAGLTPLTLSCKLARASVFREMLELSAREFWRYSNITCSAYPLSALDTLLPDGKTNWNSALFIILDGTKEEHLNMLDGGIIQKLLEEKWKTFARKQFMKRLIILCIHLIMLSISIYLRPVDQDKPLLGLTENWQDIARYCFEGGTVLGVLSYLIFQQGGEILNQGLVGFLKQTFKEPAKLIFLISNLLILACIPPRLLGDKQSEEAILVFAVPGSWFLLMFFAGAVRLTGPFVTMVYLMITGDMLTFFVIYSVILSGFTQSFFFLYKGSPEVASSLYKSYPSTWMALFQVTMGEYNYADLSYTVYPALSKTVFTIFMVLVPILLLNMLIAMMGNTYAHVIEQSEKEWMKQWAKIVVTLERAVPQKAARTYLEEYSIQLAPGDETNPEQRGFMVIKCKSQTRAKQRKGAVINWKKSGKLVIQELRKLEGTGQSLKDIIWKRSSLTNSSPIINKLQGNKKGKENSNKSIDQSKLSGALEAALDAMATKHDFNITSPIMQNIEEVHDPLRQLVIMTENNNNIDNHQIEIVANKAAKISVQNFTTPKKNVQQAKNGIESKSLLDFQTKYNCIIHQCENLSVNEYNKTVLNTKSRSTQTSSSDILLKNETQVSRPKTAKCNANSKFQCKKRKFRTTEQKGSLQRRSITMLLLERKQYATPMEHTGFSTTKYYIGVGSK
ncbi:transient receptor potential cation channel subfamily V member 5 isoform X2 [Daktulosphaira vitifoliae]|uniref:transient receptor potential cation channel subfamily V member 5 isoform X2 n=1 Tax=Daktulosphaira vitifoliae TaxID=58002 RepID=UPI0021A9EF7D|nr:transient receptor potential cation channel subfamily V member 5 isoform X2 [Daktulosphaira vitifoliae]